jgi:apolipoprotein N-acyltransferase
MARTVLGMPLGLATDEPLTGAAFLRGAGVNLLLVIAAGLLGSLAFPPYHLWWLAPLAPAPLLLALRRTREVRAAGWLALLYGLVFFGATLFWITAIFREAAVGVFILMALPVVLFGLAFRILAGRGRPWLTVLLTPVLWVAVEWIRCEGWYFQFSWGQFGFAAVSTPNGALLLSTVGVYGITFLAVLAAALLVEVFTARIPAGRRALAIAALALPLGMLGLLLTRPASPAPIADPLRAAVVQGELGNFDEFRAQTLALKDEGPALIVWPELAVAGFIRDDPRTMGELAALAREMRAVIVLGAKEQVPQDAPCDWMRRRSMLLTEGKLYANSALVVGPDGAVLGSYHKQHPIQFFADGVPGQLPPDIATPLGTLGAGICYDFDFALTNIRMVARGAEVLVVPTFDAIGWTATQHYQHGQIARARAAEAGRWTVRATSSGESMIIAPTGHAAATVPVGPDGAATADITPLHTLTPYMRLGYLLPYLCLFIGALWTAGQAWEALCGWRRRRMVKTE